MFVGTAGCGGAVKYASEFVQDGNKYNGIVYYVGGAGPVGHVGSLSVPQGMSDAGFRGYVEVFPWQGIGAAADQVNISRNRGKALDLSEMIQRDARRYPRAPIHIVALSAGTGIATFALGYLPEDVHVQNVVFLGCSLSSRYDMTRALKRVNGRLYNFHSADDIVLSRIVPYMGTIDRSDGSDGVAGLTGFAPPSITTTDTIEGYQKVLNIPYQPAFAETGYNGGHITSTSRSFITQYVARLLLNEHKDLNIVMNCPVRSASAEDDRTRPRRSRANVR